MANMLFGAGNSGINNGQIANFLAGNPNMTPEQLLQTMVSNGVSLGQVQGAVPNDARFSDATALPFLAKYGITPDVVPPTGLIGSEDAMRSGLTGAMDALQQGYDTSRADINQGFNNLNSSVSQGTSALDPFVNNGRQSLNLQAALSGALGPEAQKQAFDNFNSSPGQEFLQQRGEQAILRNASAVGGLGGSRVLQELQRQGIGLAQQDFSNQFDRLGQISGMGLNGAGNKANVIMSGANIGANLTGQLANTAQNFGNTAANYSFNTGVNLAGGRTRAGEMLADLNNQQGQGVANIINSGGSNLAQLLAGSGTASADSRMQLAQLLSSLGLNASGHVAGLPGTPGIQPTQGILGSIGQFASGLGGAMMAFK